MAKEFVLSNAARSAACDAIVDLLDVGAGTTSNCVIGTAASATDLVTIPLGATAFAAASNGVAAMTTATATGTAAAAGTAARFRLEDQATPTENKVADGNVGTTGTSFTMSITNTTIAVSDVIQLTAMSVTVPAS